MNKIKNYAFIMIILCTHYKGIFANGFIISTGFVKNNIEDIEFSLVYSGRLNGINLSVGYQINKTVEFNLGINYFKNSKQLSQNISNKVIFSLIPIELTMRLRFQPINKVFLFFGGGGSYNSFKEDFPEIKDIDWLIDCTGSNFGYHVELGSYLQFYKKFFFDFHLKYKKLNLNALDIDINMSGLAFGISMGYGLHWK